MAALTGRERRTLEAIANRQRDRVAGLKATLASQEAALARLDDLLARDVADLVKTSPAPTAVDLNGNP